MTARSILAALLCFLVAACWTGKPFYGPGETLAPIPIGEYRSTQFGGDSAGQEEKVTVSRARYGLTRIESFGKADKPSSMGFARLDGDGRWFVGWLFVDEERKPDDDVAYFLVESVDGSFRFFMPNCDTDRDIALAAGAIVVPDKKVTMCHFPDRARLEAALRAAEGRLDQGVTLAPIRD